MLLVFQCPQTYLYWMCFIYFTGHLVHTDADQGFQQFEEFGDYFNHCQFPNVVHKLLMCFHCREEQMNKICFLGQEVPLCACVRAMFICKMLSGFVWWRVGDLREKKWWKICMCDREGNKKPDSDWVYMMESEKILENMHAW